MSVTQKPGRPALHYVVDDYTDPWKNASYILLQHGNGRSGAFWYSWVPYLSRFYRVLRPDMRGLGASSANFDLKSEFTLENCVEDLITIIDDLGAQSVHVCGESAGGMVGIALAALHPQRVRTLTLVSTPVHIPRERRVTYGMTGVSEETDRDAYIEATNRSMRFPADADPGLLDWYKREFQKNRADVQAAMAAGLVNSANMLSYLPRVQAPVLGLYPSEGPITTPEQKQMLRDNLKNVRLVQLPGTFHKVQLMYPAACATHLMHFAAQHDGIASREP
ncbi:MAG: alpha/beta-hydrolase [Betaproteobacteria bacterium]|jgi:3-oxoadipate enol-lactonase|nr:alpha/beta-hydrolase [Betaproteobacteria bacterium]